MSRVPALPLRSDQKSVSTLELFFDLVFVLAVAQCTALMAANPTWTGLARGLVVLAMLWWGWVGYSWLTSAVNPEHLTVRIPLFGAMIGFAVVSMCIPSAFERETAIVFLIAYAVVRYAQIALFLLAAREDRSLHRAIAGGLGISTTLGMALLVAGVIAGAEHQVWLWGLAVLVDIAGPYFFGSDGWVLAAEHFVERHSLVVIIALGESIIAVGVAAQHPEELGVIAAVSLGTLIAGAIWWMYFDVLAIVAERALEHAEPKRVKNEMARDAYSLLHYPLIAGIVLVALGLKKSVGHVDEPLKLVGATALLGGVALVLLAIAAFGRRTTGWVQRDHLVLAVLFLAAIPFAKHVDSLVLLALSAGVLVVLVVVKSVRYREGRERARRAAGKLSGDLPQ